MYFLHIVQLLYPQIYYSGIKWNTVTNLNLTYTKSILYTSCIHSNTVTTVIIKQNIAIGLYLSSPLSIWYNCGIHKCTTVSYNRTHSSLLYPLHSIHQQYPQLYHCHIKQNTFINIDLFCNLSISHNSKNAQRNKT